MSSKCYIYSYIYCIGENTVRSILFNDISNCEVYTDSPIIADKELNMLQSWNYFDKRKPK